MSRQWTRGELAQQLRNEIMGYFGAASDFDERLAKELKLGRTDMRCLDLIVRLGPMTAGRLAEETGLTTGAVTFILDRLEEAGMVTRRRDTEDRRRVWVEIVPEAQQRLVALQQPIAEEMREVAQRFKTEELAVVRDFMRQAKEAFERQVRDAVHDSVRDSVRDAVRESVDSARRAAHEAADEAARSLRESVRASVRESVRSARDAARSSRDPSRGAADEGVAAEGGDKKGAASEPPSEEPGGKTG